MEKECDDDLNYVHEKGRELECSVCLTSSSRTRTSSNEITCVTDSQSAKRITEILIPLVNQSFAVILRTKFTERRRKINRKTDTEIKERHGRKDRLSQEKQAVLYLRCLRFVLWRRTSLRNSQVTPSSSRCLQKHPF